MATVPDGELNQHNALTQLLRGIRSKLVDPPERTLALSQRTLDELWRILHRLLRKISHVATAHLQASSLARAASQQKLTSR